MTTRRHRRRLPPCTALALICWAGPNWAAIECSMTATSVGAFYNAAANTDVTGSAVLTCTRLSTDPTTITYRLKADNGINVTGTTRRVRHQNGSANYLSYILRRGATCGNATNWQAPATGTTNVQTGTLNFGTALTASYTQPYCIRLRGTAGANPAAPPAGSYADVFNVFAQYPNNNTGALTPNAPANYSVGVNPGCAFMSLPATMAFTYTAFSASAVSQSSTFNLRCNTGVTWAVAISPASAALVGLNYNMTIPSGASGTGNGANQAVTVQATFPANQAGTCSAASCSGTQAHTLTITY